MAPKLTSSSLRNFVATTQGKSYTVGAITVLLVLVIFLVGVFPALSSIFFQIEQNGKRSEALELIETKRQTLRALSTEEESKHAVTLSLNANLPDTLDQAGLFLLINNIVNSTGCYVMSVTFNDVEVRRDFVAVFGASPNLSGKVLNIAVEGNRTNIETLIGQMENSRRIMNIRNLSLSKRDERQVLEGANTGTFRMDMQVEVYYWNKDKTK